MSRPAVRAAEPALRRVLAVAVLLAGLLGMHALTAGHEPIMSPVVDASSEPGATAHRASAALPALPGTSPQVADRPTTLAVAPATMLDEECHECGHGSGHDAGGSHLLDLCVAVLLAVLTMLLVAAAAARRHPVGALRAAVSRPLISRPARVPRPPSLTQLCVLRT